MSDAETLNHLTNIVDVVERLNGLDTKRGKQIAQLHTEMAELRDSILGLSQEIERLNGEVREVEGRLDRRYP